MTYLRIRASELLTRGAVLAMLVAGLTSVATTDASAQWRRGYGYGWGPGAVAAGVLGGVAAGALIAGAANPYPYRAAPVYAGPPARCWFEPEDVWNGYNWVRRRVRVCQ